MKRGGPLKRSTKPMKRSRLKPISSKKRKAIAAMKDERAEFRGRRCPCGQPAECHEIHGGSSRNESYMLRVAWLPLCWEHHPIVQGWKKARQYALKMLLDPEHFDRKALNRLAGWAEDAITQEEVDAELKFVTQWLREIRK